MNCAVIVKIQAALQQRNRTKKGAEIDHVRLWLSIGIFEFSEAVRVLVSRLYVTYKKGREKKAV